MPRLTKSQIRRKLLAGEPVRWRNTKGKEEGIALTTPEQRRLFSFLLSSHVREPKGLSQEFTAGLAQAHGAQDDPADEASKPEGGSQKPGPWRLQSIRTKGFGGLNLWGGEDFSYTFDEESHFIEGPNGSGKSSLVGAIIWALSGERPRDQVNEPAHETAPVYGEDDGPVGRWPPIASYPDTLGDLVTQPDVQVELVLKNPSGDTALVKRSLTEGRVKEFREPGLEIPQILLEIGALMPARLAHIRMKEGRGQLVEAVQKLTGLDELRAIGAMADGLCHKGREYLAYARNQNITTLHAEFDEAIEATREALEPTGLSVRAFVPADTDDQDNIMVKFGKDLAERAARFTATIAEDLSAGLDLTDSKVQQQISSAIQSAKTAVSAGLSACETWNLLETIADALRPEALKPLMAAVDRARSGLAEALHFLKRGSDDSRLRLKAVGAHWHAQHSSGLVEDCPLCGQSLRGHKLLASELDDLAKLGESAGRTFQDNLNALSTELDSAIPQPLHHLHISGLQPRQALLEDIQHSLGRASSHSPLLVKLVRIVEAAISRAPAGDIESASTAQLGDLPNGADSIVARIEEAEHLIALERWFGNKRHEWIQWWSEISYAEDSERETGAGAPTEGFAFHLSRLSEAVDAAAPYRAATLALRKAFSIGRRAAEIDKEQARRARISESLEPLKKLADLIESESKQAVNDLSGRVSEILSAVYLTERLQFHRARLDRRDGVVVRGGFAPEVVIDATLVANSSWLRAVLWAFLFALREEAVTQLGEDQFPILVLDDPQVTFDAEHRHRWAQYVAGLQKSTSKVQVLLTTYDETFLDLVKMDGLTGRHALIASPSPEFGHVMLLEGDAVDRKWTETHKLRTPQAGQDFMAAVRIQAEGMLKLMLRGEAQDIRNSTIGQLRETLRQLHSTNIPPWNNPVFGALLKELDQGRPEVRQIEAAHHTTGRNLGMSEAFDVNKHWRKGLKKVLEKGFRVARDHRLLHGGLKALHAPEPELVLPEGHQTKIRSTPLRGCFENRVLGC